MTPNRVIAVNVRDFSVDVEPGVPIPTLPAFIDLALGVVVFPSKNYGGSGITMHGHTIYVREEPHEVAELIDLSKGAAA